MFRQKSAALFANRACFLLVAMSAATSVWWGVDVLAGGGVQTKCGTTDPEGSAAATPNSRYLAASEARPARICCSRAGSRATPTSPRTRFGIASIWKRWDEIRFVSWTDDENPKAKLLDLIVTELDLDGPDGRWWIQLGRHIGRYDCVLCGGALRRKSRITKSRPQCSRRFSPPPRGRYPAPDGHISR